MTKFFILNIVLNLAIVFMAYSGFQGYQSGNMLTAGLGIAFLVVLIYLKVVLSKKIKSVLREKDAEKKEQYSALKGQKKKA